MITCDELKAKAEELADHCIADIEKYWSYTPSTHLQNMINNSPMPDHTRSMYDWKTTLRYHLARAITERLHSDKGN